MRLSRRFLPALALDVFRGGPVYGMWIAALAVGTALGAGAYLVQVTEGFGVTNMTDQVSWGAYIANFTFGVGIVDAFVMVMIPAYVYRMASFQRVVFVGEMFALSAVVMCLLFVTVDIGRPERAWHLVPFLGSLNFPASILSWDVVVLGGYFFINAGLIAMGLRAKYYGGKRPRIYVPLIFVSMVWAVSMHVVTAFLYTWLGARPYWNSAIVVPRFIASAFVVAPAALILALHVLRREAGFPVEREVFVTLRRIMTITLLVNVFLFASEAFTELFSGSLHATSIRYLLFGHGEHVMLRAYVWTGITLSLFALTVLLSPLAKRSALVQIACVAAIVGVWIEKGMALVVPGFVPTPIGEVVEYVPSQIEALVSLGIWSFGLLLFTVFVRLGARVESGDLRAPEPVGEARP